MVLLQYVKEHITVALPIDGQVSIHRWLYCTAKGFKIKSPPINRRAKFKVKIQRKNKDQSLSHFLDP